MTWYTVAWLLWLGAFFAIELPAIFNKQSGDTLSEHVWFWFAVDVDAERERLCKRGNVWLWRLRRLALIILMAWLSLHFLTGGSF